MDRIALSLAMTPGGWETLLDKRVAQQLHDTLLSNTLAASTNVVPLGNTNTHHNSATSSSSSGSGMGGRKLSQTQYHSPGSKARSSTFTGEREREREREWDAGVSVHVPGNSFLSTTTTTPLSTTRTSPSKAVMTTMTSSTSMATTTKSPSKHPHHTHHPHHHHHNPPDQLIPEIVAKLVTQASTILSKLRRLTQEHGLLTTQLEQSQSAYRLLQAEQGRNNTSPTCQPSSSTPLYEA